MSLYIRAASIARDLKIIFTLKKITNRLFFIIKDKYIDAGNLCFLKAGFCGIGFF